jgi:hypothetical protein
MAGRQRSRTPRGVVSRGDETTDVVVAAEKFATFLHKQFLCNKAPARTVQQTAALARDAGAGGVRSLAAGGASVKVANASATNLSIGLTSYSKNKVRRVDIVTAGTAKCVGGLADVKPGTGVEVAPRDELAMTCVRQAGAKGSLDEVVVQIEVAGQRAWRHTWPGRGPCGSLGQRSCNGSLPAPYPEKFAEEASGYSATETAASRRASLEAVSKAEIPGVCDDTSRESQRSQMSKRFRGQWDQTRVLASTNHSCTKGSSGGRKDCGCVRTIEAPGGFEPHDLAKGGKGNRTISWEGSMAQICMHKNGKGSDKGSVTAIWKLTAAAAAGRTSTDLAFVMARSSCFNGCDTGLMADGDGVCR